MGDQQINEETLKPEKLENFINGHKTEVEVLPNFGAMLTSFKIDGMELIYFSREKLIERDFTGCFMMFPTPCRLTGSKYTFEGKEVRQAKYGRDVDIHGLIRDEPFAVTREGQSLICTIEIDAGHPVYEGYPFPCRFSLTFKLLERGLEIEVECENTGNENMPFGFGLHPFWRIPGDRKDTFVQVPCERTLDLVNLIPTGSTTLVEGTDLDFRSFVSLEGIDIDNAFWGRDTSSEQAIEHRKHGIKITLESSEIFEHMIAYAPNGNPFVCMENLTCTPDAPNVYAKGKKEVSGLKVISPGQKLQGWVRFVVTDL